MHFTVLVLFDVLWTCATVAHCAGPDPAFLWMPLFTCLHELGAHSWDVKMAFTLKDLLYGGLLLLSLLMSKVPRGGGAAGCSDLRTPQAPALASPDNQMGQIVSLSASREDRANSLIWSLLMESLEGNFCHFVLPLFPSPLLPNWKFPLLSVTKPSPTGEAEI